MKKEQIKKGKYYFIEFNDNEGYQGVCEMISFDSKLKDDWNITVREYTRVHSSVEYNLTGKYSAMASELKFEVNIETMYDDYPEYFI